MLEFRDIDISDRDRINAALRISGFRGCEYSFANNLAWRRLSDTRIAFWKDFYIVCAFAGGSPSFILPAGKGSYTELFAELKRFAESMDSPLHLTGVTADSLDMLRELFPGQFTEEYDRDNSDYIYNSSDLISLAGRKYHGKRNHLARFSELDCTYSPVTEADFDDCIIFCTNAYNNRRADSDESDHSFAAEQFAINTYFTYYAELGLRGGIIRIGGNTAAVTIGEELTPDTFCVHIEKADTSYSGIYAGINNCFARAEAEGYRYVNREEDLGIEGLRKAKLSYHPVFLLDKYTVTFK